MLNLQVRLLKVVLAHGLFVDQQQNMIFLKKKRVVFTVTFAFIILQK